VAASGLALTVACGGDGGTDPGGGGGGGSTAFTAKIDGVEWTTDAARLQVLPGSVGIPGSLLITGTKVTGNKVLSITITLGFVRFAAIYPLGVNQGTTPGGTAIIVEQDGANVETRMTPLDGSRNFTVISNDGSHIKGTFQFVAQPMLRVCPGGQPHHHRGHLRFRSSAGFTVVGTVDRQFDLADLQRDHFNGATVTALGANGVVAMGDDNHPQPADLNHAGHTNGTTLNLLNGVRITVLDLSNGQLGGISGDVGTVHFSGMSAERTNGEFSGTLQPNTGSGATGVLTIANGSFYMRILTP
jgi:hypothetical protein